MPDQDEITIRLPIAFIDALSHAGSIEAVVRVGTQWLPHLISAARSSIAILDDGKLIDHAIRTDGVADPTFDTSRIMPGTPRGEVMRTGLPMALDEKALVAANTRALNMLHASGIRSMLIVPLKSGARAVGTLSVGARAPDGFPEATCRELMAVGQWIASQAHLMQQLRATARLAETDALTGLANRTRLMHVLDGPGALHLPAADGSMIGVMHVDLDHFKSINDTQGHAAGDAVLRHAAQVMRNVTGPKDLVARVGGDEFVIAARTDSEGQRLARLARDLAQRISKPISINGVQARVGASIGTAIANDLDRTADRLIGNADIALYEVKRNGRGGVLAFCEGMRAAYESSQRLLGELHDAVAKRLFEPYFQPQVSMTTGHLTGFEMLARWPHPVLGVLAPDDFLDLAAESHLLEQIDTMVRAKGLTALRALRNDGWDAPKMSFNASVNTLRDPDLIDDLLGEIRGQGLCPSDLVLEIREAQLIDSADATTRRNIGKLIEAGFRVELDEFGTGCASMSNLKTLPISGIKLDRSVISPLPDTCSESILRAMITLARDLDLTVVAGGVENASQFATLRRLGCDVAQGFGISHPLPLPELITFMEGYGSAPVALAQ